MQASSSTSKGYGARLFDAWALVIVSAMFGGLVVAILSTGCEAGCVRHTDCAAPQLCILGSCQIPPDADADAVAADADVVDDGGDPDAEADFDADAIYADADEVDDGGDPDADAETDGAIPEVDADLADAADADADAGLEADADVEPSDGGGDGDTDAGLDDASPDGSAG